MYVEFFFDVDYKCLIYMDDFVGWISWIMFRNRWLRMCIFM